MSETPPARTAKLRRRGPRFWAATLTIIAILTLYVGSQIARHYGQSVNWYTGFGQWLGALGSFGAAGVALWISVDDRLERRAEQFAAEKTQARLVRLSVGWISNRAAVQIRVENFGPLPVLDVELTAAEWSEHPQARWIALDTGQRNGPTHTSTPMLKARVSSGEPLAEVLTLAVSFVDPDTNEQLASVVPRTADYPYPSYESIDLSTFVARIRFTTANGVRWEIETNGIGTADDPTRL